MPRVRFSMALCLKYVMDYVGLCIEINWDRTSITRATEVSMANFSATTVSRVPTRGSQLGMPSGLSHWQLTLLTHLPLLYHEFFASMCLLAPLDRLGFQMQAIGVFQSRVIHMHATFGFKERTMVLSR